MSTQSARVNIGTVQREGGMEREGDNCQKKKTIRMSACCVRILSACCCVRILYNCIQGISIGPKQNNRRWEAPTVKY